MSSKSDIIPIKNELLDRRIKLTQKQKSEIRQKYFYSRIMILNNKLHPSVSQRSLAKEYGVSRRTIVFVLYPERLKASNYPGHWKKYYNKDYNTVAQRKHRAYKKELFEEGKI